MMGYCRHIIYVTHLYNYPLIPTVSRRSTDRQQGLPRIAKRKQDNPELTIIVFEKIKIQWKGENTGYALRENTFVNDGNNFSTITIGGAAQLYSNYALSMNAAYLTATNDVFTLVRQFRENIASSNKVESFSNSNGMIHIYKFIGIGRKN